ncbi:hypothetical protein BaRGS_00005807 [Batillaria attramentaria]|uniref:Peptidase S1 domain-containing protein n=1 Tax=Batillaria attramentaria TaxID=370345 RepID=A0ABD0LUI4_9CAEN
MFAAASAKFAKRVPVDRKCVCVVCFEPSHDESTVKSPDRYRDVSDIAHQGTRNEKRQVRKRKGKRDVACVYVFVCTSGMRVISFSSRDRDILDVECKGMAFSGSRSAIHRFIYTITAKGTLIININKSIDNIISIVNYIIYIIIFINHIIINHIINFIDYIIINFINDNITYFIINHNNNYVYHYHCSRFYAVRMSSLAAVASASLSDCCATVFQTAKMGVMKGQIARAGLTSGSVPCGQCVSDADRCNQVYDCLDFSDEALCPDCSGFQCDSGICLWDGSQGRCNGVFDCSDLSDEMGCPPRAGTVACANTVRVLQSQWCNGLDNCGDNSDEINCGRSCSVGRVACPDGRCILRTWLCDGYPDCTDGSDEEGCGTCEPTQLACDNHQCIEEGAVCDGQPDCRAGEDESACFSTEETDTGVLWVRYRGKDYAVCSDVWSPALGEQVCGDINHQFLSVSEAVKPAAHITSFAAFSSVALDAKTSNIVIKDSCDTGHVVSVSCQKQECGQRQVPFVQSFVAGGEIVPPGKWPWVVSLLYLGQAICGGTLIDKKWVVTAAHCILSATKGDYDFTATPYYFDVIVGSTHRMGRSSVGTPFRVRVDKIFLYPERKVSLYGTVDWDIALLRLSVPVEITNYIQPLCLPHFGQHIPLTSLCYLAGWGQTSPQQVVPLDHLRDTRMQLWSETRCSRNTVPGETTVNTNSTICGGFIFGRPSGCQGDSGGPLMCWSASGRWMLAGVMSRGSSPCGLYQPGLRANRFARVASVVDWIQQQIGDQ